MADIRHRSIRMSEERRAMLAMAAAHLNTTSEAIIQAAITAALIALASEDPTLNLMLARTAGLDWNVIEELSDEQFGILNHLGFGR
jgi:uncharacterized protein (DUF1778 family)